MSAARRPRALRAEPLASMAMNDVRNRIEIMHGVNLDQLGRRDPAHYGSGTLADLERSISHDGAVTSV